jgi:hypothetical protein
MPSYNFVQPISSNTWTVNHNLNSNFIATDAMKLTVAGVYQKVLPFRVTLPTKNTMILEFEISISGRARVVVGTPPV